MAAKIVFFNTDIRPACLYCKNGKNAPDNIMIHCSKNGPVAPTFYCAKFIYNPLKRIPPRAPKLPSYSPRDFSLE